jgi:hypothetical protein
MSARNRSTPCCSMSSSVCRSTPAAPPLLRTRLHASHKTSLLWIRSYSAWKRRVLLCLAHTHSLRWSSRTLSTTGLFSVSGMPSRLPLHKPDQSRAPSLQRVILHAFLGTTDPSDSLPAPRDFSHPALYPRSLPDSAARCRVSPVPRSSLETCHRPIPRKGPAIVPAQTAVCCLRRDMTGSALSNTFRLKI